MVKLDVLSILQKSAQCLELIVCRFELITVQYTRICGAVEMFVLTYWTNFS